MSVINVSRNDNFNDWRGKTNSLSTNLGDIADLNTVATNAVDAINEVKDSVGDLDDLEIEADDLVDAINKTRKRALAFILALG